MIQLTAEQLKTLLSAHAGHDWIGRSLALFGTALTLIVGWVTLVLNKRAKEQEILLNALEFLGGGTQKRSVGIALSEQLGKKFNSRSVIKNVLEAQELYLSTKSIHDEMTDKTRAVEDLNLKRIRDILADWK